MEAGRDPRFTEIFLKLREKHGYSGGMKLHPLTPRKSQKLQVEASLDKTFTRIKNERTEASFRQHHLQKILNPVEIS